MVNDANTEMDPALLYESLMSFQLGDGSFVANKGQETDIESTEYAVMALYSKNASASPFDLHSITPSKTVKLLSNKGSLLYYGALFIGVMAIVYICLVIVGKIGKSMQKRKEEQS